MKKFMNWLVLATTALLTVGFTACGDDEGPDFDLSTSGSVTIKSESGYTTEAKVTSAEVRLNIDGLSTFNAYLSEDDYVPYNFVFYTESKIQKGSVIKATDVAYINSGSAVGYHDGNPSGKVEVTEVSDKYVKVKFTNFKFSNLVGYDKTSDLIFNGEIKYEIDTYYN